MIQEDINLYGGIFDIANQNMIKSNQRFLYNRNEFLLMVESNPNCVDLLDFIDSSNEEFLFLCYVALLRRIPDQVAYESWKKAIDLPQNEFQKMLLEAILKSQEFSIKKVNVVNNYTGICLDKDNKQNNNSMNDVIDRLQNKWIYKMYKRAPVKLKLKIRKLFGYDMP